MKKYGIIAVLGTMIVAGCITNPADTRVYNPVDYGAVADGQTLCTVAIQKAIDACYANGGGVVRLPEGRFLSGTIFMKSGVTLDLSEGSTLLGSPHLKHYPATAPAVGPYVDRYSDKSLIRGDDLKNIAITGKGTVDGQGVNFQKVPGVRKGRPYVILFVSCRNVRVEDITRRNSTMWMQQYLWCDNVTLRGITVWNHCNRNNDGIDIDGCHNVLIENCTVDSHDDAICLKSRSGRMCENVTIRNCTARSWGNPIKCGTESIGGFKNITISNCTIRTTEYLRPELGHAGIALEIVDGGIMDNVNVSHIDIVGSVRAPIFIRLGNRGRTYDGDPDPPGVGILRNVTISDIKYQFTEKRQRNMGCAIAGLEGHPIENVTLRNLDISVMGGGLEKDSIRRFDERPAQYPECNMFGLRLPAYGFYFWHVKGVRIENVKVRTTYPDARNVCVLEDVSDIIIDDKVVRGPQDLPEGYQLSDDMSAPGKRR